MFSKIGTGELIVILIVALFVIGPDKLPGLARALGKAVGEARKYLKDITDEIEEETTALKDELKDIENDIKEMDKDIENDIKEMGKDIDNDVKVMDKAIEKKENDIENGVGKSAKAEIEPPPASDEGTSIINAEYSSEASA